MLKDITCIKMNETKVVVLAHIMRTKDSKGEVTINQHEVANKYNLNAGNISKFIKDLRDEFFLVKIKGHAAGRPAVYRVCI